MRVSADGAGELDDEAEPRVSGARQSTIEPAHVTILLLLVSFALIVAGAALFTNGVEWLGQRLNLGQSAVGSLLAAVGTALPESTIPIVAVLAGAEGEEVAIGAIIGAPFMLATVAMLLVATSALVFRERREQGRNIDVRARTVRRDFAFFLPSFAFGLAARAVRREAAAHRRRRAPDPRLRRSTCAAPSRAARAPRTSTSSSRSPSTPPRRIRRTGSSSGRSWWWRSGSSSAAPSCSWRS